MTLNDAATLGIRVHLHVGVDVKSRIHTWEEWHLYLGSIDLELSIGSFRFTLEKEVNLDERKYA